MTDSINNTDNLWETIGDIYTYAKSKDWTRGEFVKFLRDSQTEKGLMFALPGKLNE